jgi:hypothetical protein
MSIASKRCFVTSPKGAGGSPEREHANDAFDFQHEFESLLEAHGQS